MFNKGSVPALISQLDRPRAICGGGRLFLRNIFGGTGSRKVAPAQVKRMLRIVCIFALVAAMSAGQVSIPYISNFLPYPFAQARFALIVLAALGVFLTKRGEHNRNSIGLACLLAILSAFLAIHASVYGAKPASDHYIVDLIFLASFGFATATLIRHEGDLRIFCSGLVFVAIPLMLIWYIRDQNTFTGFTTVTYYRVEFFAFAASMYFAIKGVRIAWLAAAAFLFATMDSTSRAAVVFAPISVAYFCFTLAARVPITQKPFRRSALVPLALLIAVTALFIPARSSTVTSRMNAGVGQQASNGEQITEADRNMDGVAKNNFFTFNDGTQRVRLAVKALELVKESPIKGIGIGRYSQRLLNSAADGFDEYKYPHDVSLEVLYSTGILGFGLYGACIVIFLIAMYRKIIENPDATAIGCGAIFALITSHFAGDFYDFRMFWILVIASLAATSAPASPSVSAA